MQTAPFWGLYGRWDNIIIRKGIRRRDAILREYIGLRGSFSFLIEGGDLRGI